MTPNIMRFLNSGNPRVFARFKRNDIHDILEEKAAMVEGINRLDLPFIVHVAWFPPLGRTDWMVVDITQECVEGRRGI
jgi:hypothetical protein